MFAVEVGVGHDLTDLVAQGLEVVGQRSDAVGVERGVSPRQSLGLHLVQQVRDRLTGRHCHVHGGLGPVQRVLHSVEGGDVGAGVLGDGPDGAVVLRIGHAQTGGDPVLHGLQLGLGRSEVLQRRQCGVIRIDAGHFGTILFSGVRMRFARGGFLPTR